MTAAAERRRDLAGSGALSNFTRQETPEDPRMNNLLRVDGRRRATNSYWLSYRQFSSNQFRIRIHRGRPSGAFQRQLRLGRQRLNGGWNHISKRTR